MSYLPVAYAELETGWSLPDSIMAGVWTMLVNQNRDEDVFYDGSILGFEEFIKYMQQPSNYPTIVFNVERSIPAMVAWFNSVKDQNCQAHFVCLEGSNPIKAGKTVLDWWASWDMIKNIVGITPDTNERALKFVQKLGFKTVGTIPDFCNLYYENRRVGGTISYYNLNGGHHG